MRGKRYSEEEIINVLKQSDAGMPIAEVCRTNGISSVTFYKWKSKFGGMQVSDAKRLRVLEDENGRLKHIVADLTLDNQALKAVVSKNF